MAAGGPATVRFSTYHGAGQEPPRAILPLSRLVAVHDGAAAGGGAPPNRVHPSSSELVAAGGYSDTAWPRLLVALVFAVAVSRPLASWTSPRLSRVDVSEAGRRWTGGTLVGGANSNAPGATLAADLRSISAVIVMVLMPSVGVSVSPGGGSGDGDGGLSGRVGGGGMHNKRLPLAGARPHTRGDSAGSETVAQRLATSHVCSIAGAGMCIVAAAVDVRCCAGVAGRGGTARHA